MTTMWRSRGEAGARDAGKLRLEGKDYVVKDGDVLHFRFADLSVPLSPIRHARPKCRASTNFDHEMPLSRGGPDKPGHDGGEG